MLVYLQPNNPEPSRRILIFGDSNTYGFQPLGERYAEAVRYTGRLQALLGPDVRIIEEGLPGRTCVFDDPDVEGRNGLPYLFPCMMSHGPLDTLVIMLGTNDIKERFGASAVQIAQNLGTLVDKARAVPAWKGEPDILLVAPCPVASHYQTGLFSVSMGSGCYEKSRQLSAEYQKLAQLKNCRFLDAGTLPGIETHPLDGMHLTAKAHVVLAEGLAPLLR